jgi:hypothetical protein
MVLCGFSQRNCLNGSRLFTLLHSFLALLVDYSLEVLLRVWKGLEIREDGSGKLQTRYDRVPQADDRKAIHHRGSHHRLHRYRCVLRPSQ